MNGTIGVVDDWALWLCAPNGKAFSPKGVYEMANKRLGKALEWVRDWDRKIAIDVGACNGVYSAWLSYNFDRVYAFEPHPMNQRAFLANKNKFSSLSQLTFIPCGLSDKNETLEMHNDENTGFTAWARGVGDIPFVPLDSFGLSPNFIKIDCEGMDHKVLMGGEQTIRENMPVIMIEIAEDTSLRNEAEWYGPMQIQDTLESWGYAHVRQMSIDHIFVRKDFNDA